MGTCSVKLIVNSEPSLSKAIGQIRESWKASRYLEVSIRAGTNRSLEGNALSHVWYDQIANELREGTALDAKCEAKLYCGVPILRAEDADFRASYDALVKGRFSNEEKLELMRWFPVTSLMTKDQLSQFLEAMQKHWSGRGVQLIFPDKAARAA